MTVTTSVLGVNQSRLAFQQLFKATRQQVVTEVRRSTVSTRAKAKAAAPVASGTMKGQIRERFEKDGLVGIVEALADYSRWVEGKINQFRFGRRPGRMPPDAPIRAWVAIKGLPESAVFPIRRKIAREGTRAQPFLTPSFEVTNKEFVKKRTEIFRRAAEQAAKIGLAVGGA
jgi:hypothetical protein